MNAFPSTSLHLALLGLALLASPAAFAQSISDKAGRGDLAFMRDEDPAMQKAFAKARETLDGFLAKAAEDPPELSRFSLKVAVSEGSRTEYFWVGNFEKVGPDSFAGEIGNRPRMVSNVKFGERHVFPRSRIVDWTYMNDTERRMAGNFTLCALLTKEPKAEAEAMKQRFKLDCSWLK